MAHTQTTTVSPINGCYCKTTRPLIGKNVTTRSLHARVPGRVVTVTDVRHRPGRPGLCRAVLDGLWLHPMGASSGNPIDVAVTTEDADLQVRVREPFPARTGTITFDDATEIIRDVHARYATVGDAIPRLPSGDPRIRRAFAPPMPQLPPSLRSYYTTGRVRRIPSTGRWAADLGHSGATRPLGEYDSIDDARAAVIEAHAGAWGRLEEWLRSVVDGDWELERLPLAGITVEDRMSTLAAAKYHGLAPSTWRSYVARGQAPAPDGSAGAQNPWWHRATVTGWERPGQGARTDMRGPSDPDQPVEMVQVLLAVGLHRGAISAWDTGETVQQAAERFVAQARVRLADRGHADPEPARILAEILDWLQWEQRPYADYQDAYDQDRAEIEEALAAAGVEWGQN